MRARRAACGVLLLAAAGCGAPGEQRAAPAPAPALAPPAAGTARALVLQDDARFLGRDAASVRADMRRVRALGVGVVRLTASWSRIAPEPTADRRPPAPFDPADPATYPAGAWEHLDVAVRAATSAGLRPEIDIAFWAPRWAVGVPAADRDGPSGIPGSPPRERERPAPAAFAAFAEAVARRYDGRTEDADGERLPRVVDLATWNEPNHPSFLAPQWERDAGGAPVAASPAVYRAMHAAADAAIRRVRPDARVVLGNLSARGWGGRGDVRGGVPPLRFLRELACVDDDLRPRRDGDCARFRPLRADAIALHPYTRETPPGAPRGGDEAGTADLAAFTALVRELAARGRIVRPARGDEAEVRPGGEGDAGGALGAASARAAGDDPVAVRARTPPVWLTEQGFETSEDDPTAPFTREQQARFLGWSAELAWRAAGVATDSQFLLWDIDPAESGLPASDPRRYRDWQSGVLDARGRPKPGAAALRLPFRPLRIGEGPARRLRFFGAVRPMGAVRRVRIERRAADGRWAPARVDACGRARPGCPAGDRGGAASEDGTFSTDGSGALLRTAPDAGPGPYRLAWRRDDGAWVRGAELEAVAPADEGG